MAKEDISTHQIPSPEDIPGLFLSIPDRKPPVSKILNTGPHAGEHVELFVRRVGMGKLEYRARTPDKLIAKIEVRGPHAGLCTLSRTEVARDYWRCGIARMLLDMMTEHFREFGARPYPLDGDMSPDAARMWKDYYRDDPAFQAYIDPILSEMEASGRIKAYDELKREGSGWWGGEWIGPDRFKHQIQEWKDKGYTEAIYDREEGIIFPRTPQDDVRPEDEIIIIEGNEARIESLLAQVK